MGPYELLQKVITAFEELNIRYIVTGSVASMAYGEPVSRGFGTVKIIDQEEIHDSKERA